MAMNRRGQVMLVGLMIGIIAFMAAMVFIDPIKDVVTVSRGATQLDCSNDSISDGNKMTCLMVDLLLPGFIGVVFGLAATAIGSKFIG